MILFNTLCIFLGLTLDKIFGEPNRFHPLVGFGYLANDMDQIFNKGFYTKFKGMLSVLLLLGPITYIIWQIDQSLSDEPWAKVIFNSFVLYTAIGWRSLGIHAQSVIDALNSNSLSLARSEVAKIVSRNTKSLNEEEVAAAACESVLENGADAIFSAIFWFLIAGAPGVVLYRLANTLDAMWGYKTTRYIHFGWFAARLDDVLNYIPARLTSLAFALCGKTGMALAAWRSQGWKWKSPNAGPVMASGAGALDIRLGGPAIYHGRKQDRPILGNPYGHAPSANALAASLKLVNRSLLLWYICIVVGEVALMYSLGLLPSLESLSFIS